MNDIITQGIPGCEMAISREDLKALMMLTFELLAEFTANHSEFTFKSINDEKQKFLKEIRKRLDDYLPKYIQNNPNKFIQAMLQKHPVNACWKLLEDQNHFLFKRIKGKHFNSVNIVVKQLLAVVVLLMQTPKADLQSTNPTAKRQINIHFELLENAIVQKLFAHARRGHAMLKDTDSKRIVKILEQLTHIKEKIDALQFQPKIDDVSNSNTYPPFKTSSYLEDSDELVGGHISLSEEEYYLSSDEQFNNNNFSEEQANFNNDTHQSLERRSYLENSDESVGGHISLSEEEYYLSSGEQFNNNSFSEEQANFNNDTHQSLERRSYLEDSDESVGGHISFSEEEYYLSSGEQFNNNSFSEEQARFNDSMDRDEKNKQEILRVQKLLEMKLNERKNYFKELVEKRKQMNELKQNIIEVSKDKEITQIQKDSAAYSKALIKLIYNSFSRELTQANFILTHMEEIKNLDEKIEAIENKIFYLSEILLKLPTANNEKLNLLHHSWEITKTLIQTPVNDDGSIQIAINESRTLINGANNTVSVLSLNEALSHENKLSDKKKTALTTIQLINFMLSKGKKTISIQSHDATIKLVVENYLRYLENECGLVACLGKIRTNNKQANEKDANKIWGKLYSYFFSLPNITAQPWYEKVASLQEKNTSVISRLTMFHFRPQDTRDIVSMNSTQATEQKSNTAYDLVN
ncbi:hypothetical protein [Legionella clemsonensis]|uniref:Uncharacterized protein n=1 Tax=Legionella clemsonensis TaxID=1867846 RepID=A0A222P2Y2_9GAMM|nr:hypothetical protein [Legionella clemsonensis]ASQ46199.1 hypothetical protein clem_08235 [Legionella clemsonensis]